MKTTQIVLTLFVLTNYCTTAQNSVGVGTINPSPNSILDIVATDKGIFIPRLTTLQRIGMLLTASEEGLLTYDIDEKHFYYWNGNVWISLFDMDNDVQNLSLINDSIAIEGGNIILYQGDGDWARNGDALYNLNTGNVSIGDSLSYAKLTVYGLGNIDSNATFNIINATGDTIFLIGNNGFTGIDMGNPSVSLDVMGDEIVGIVTPRYLGPDTFVIPGSLVTASYTTEIVWTRNHHLYVKFDLSSQISWMEALNAARFVSGYLPTVTSAAENQFIIQNVLGTGRAAIGFTDAVKEGEWRWMTGEVAVATQNGIFTAWLSSQPDDYGNCGGQDGAGYSNAATDPLRRWIDVNIDTQLPTCSEMFDELIIEFGYVRSP